MRKRLLLCLALSAYVWIVALYREDAIAFLNSFRTIPPVGSVAEWQAARRTHIAKENIRIQTWGPDTCGCRIQTAYDGRYSQMPVMIPTAADACPAHRKLKTLDALYRTVMRENQAKNRAVGAMAHQYGVAPESVSWSVQPDRSFVLIAGDHRKQVQP